MCDGGLEDGCLAASRDDTTINALDIVSITSKHTFHCMSFQCTYTYMIFTHVYVYMLC